MTTYKIETNASGEIFVKAFDKTDELGIGRFAGGGPYKNEESAKRRIRDLKRKDAEAPDTASSLMPDQGEETILTPMVTIGTPQHAKLMTERNIINNARSGKNEAVKRIVDNIAFDPTPRPSHYAAPNAIEPGPKFTIPTLLSSEWDYGGPFTFRQLGQPLSEFTTHRTFATPEMVAHARRPIGVYPAVAKKFYRRQWR